MAGSSAPRPKHNGVSRDYLRGLMRRIAALERPCRTTGKRFFGGYEVTTEVRW
jgi:hypothetical protein